MEGESPNLIAIPQKFKLWTGFYIARKIIQSVQKFTWVKTITI